MKKNGSKKKGVLDLSKIPELNPSEIPKIKDMDLPDLNIEDLNLPELLDLETLKTPGRGELIIGLLKNLIPGLKISKKERSVWIQTFKKMGAVEISRIVSLSQDEKSCRRAIEKAVKTTEK